MEMTTLRPGDGVLTRRIKKRCKQLGIPVKEEGSWNKFGYEVTGYHVPLSIYEEERSRRNQEVAERQQREAERQERANQRRRELRLEDLTLRFPGLSEAQLLAVADTRHFTAAELGYQFGNATKSYWRKLGYRVTGPSCGFVVRGSRVHPVFTAKSLVEHKSRVSVKTRWKKMCESLGNEVALAEVLRLANRLQKVMKIANFYKLKDEWIGIHQDKLTEGRVARNEVRECWACNGTGFGRDGEECWKCDGSGVHSARTLYEHRFKVGGRTYTFHSYVRPRHVLEEEGADERHYGRPFKPEELPLPPQSQLVEMVRLGLSELKTELEKRS